MAIIKSYTDLSQSKKLAEILPLESADMKYPYFGNAEWGETPRFGEPIEYSGNKDKPCWSLAALLSVLPKGYSSVLTKSFNGKDYYCKLDGKLIETTADNPVDACYEVIIKLYELKML